MAGQRVIKQFWREEQSKRTLIYSIKHNLYDHIITKNQCHYDM